jgi:hypothetical protein
MGGSLDLVGLNDGNLSDPGDSSSGSTGGSLTAGNTQIVGSLGVQGQSNFAQGVSVLGNFTNSGSALFHNSANSTTAFQIQNVAGTNLFNVDTTNAKVVISTLEISGHILTSGDTPSIVAGTGAGTGPTVSVTGNDVSGTVTITTGTGTTDGLLATITFVNAYGSAPKVTLTPTSTNALLYYVGSSTATFTISDIFCALDSLALHDATTYTFNYWVAQ